MKPRLDGAFYTGLALVVAGGAALLAEFAPAVRTVELTVAGLFLVMGAVGTGIFVRAHQAWSLPLAAGALAIGLMTASDVIAPGRLGDWAAMLLFTLLGISFLVLSAVPAPRWWPILPAGVMLTLAGTVATGADATGGGVFLAGLGTTFLAVYLVPPRPVRRTWALVTGAVLVVLALPASGLSGQVIGVAVAVALMVGGMLLLLRGPRATT